MRILSPFPLALGALLLLHGTPVLAGTSAFTGTKTGSLLKMAPGARAPAMGEAFVAVADDVTTLYYNPAGLIAIDRFEANIQHAIWFSGTQFDYAAVGLRLHHNFAVAFSGQLLTVGDVQARDIVGQPLGEIKPSEGTFEAALSMRVTGVADPNIWWDGFSIGVKFKNFYSKLTERKSAFSGGISLLSPGYLNGRFRFGISIDNIGGGLTHDSRADNLPNSARVGFSFVGSPDWIIALDGLISTDNQAGLGLGTERLIHSDGKLTVALRGGLNTRTLNQIDGVSIFSAGIGFILPSLQIDYAIVPFGDLGVTHRAALTFRFGTPVTLDRSSKNTDTFINKSDFNEREQELKKLRETEILLEESYEEIIPWVE